MIKKKTDFNSNVFIFLSSLYHQFRTADNSQRTDVRNGRFYITLILRRNEAERNNALQYFQAYSFGMHATKGSTNFSISNQNPSHPIFFYQKRRKKLFFCLFASFFFSFRDQEYLLLPVWAKGKLLHFSCVYLPEAPLASACIAHSLRHHFWTGLARLFCTTKKSFCLNILSSLSFFQFLFISKCRWNHLV